MSPDIIVPDPANPQSFNRFSYVRNNPLRFTDPSGHIDCAVLPLDDSQACNGDPNAYDRSKPVNLETTRAIIDDWKQTGALNDPNRTDPLRAPIVVNNHIIGWHYAMPVGANQSTVSKDSGFYKFGRFLAGVGIAIDFGELILSPIPGAGIGPGYTDAAVTYLSGAFTGENYLFFNTPPGLPSMISINQDAIVNGAEAIVPPLTAAAFGVSSLLADAATAPIPGDSAIYMSGGVIATQLIDATTSTMSAIYDGGRYNGSIANYFTVGISDEGLVIVYWPQN